MKIEVHTDPETKRIEALVFPTQSIPAPLFSFFCNLLPKTAVADGPLQSRWSACVLCSREFSSYWAKRPGRPAPLFFLSTEEA